LTDEQKNAFEAAYHGTRGLPITKLLIKEHPYTQSSVVEAHAEVYRYLGIIMPESLKEFYPKLI
jgi:UTP-glucose-1-phosphate uridylyltransferase